MTLTRTIPGLIQKDNFDTNTLANYTTSAATWNSTDKCVTLTHGGIENSTLSISDSIFTARVKVDMWNGGLSIYTRYRAGYYDSIILQLGASLIAMQSIYNYLGYDASGNYLTGVYYRIRRTANRRKVISSGRMFSFSLKEHRVIRLPDDI